MNVSDLCFEGVRRLKFLVFLFILFGLTVNGESQIVIGGPDGVVIGRGFGLRIGGNNGVHLGGGRGARFGPPGYGVQLGGGYGAQFGPYPNGVHLGGNGQPPEMVVTGNGNRYYGTRPTATPPPGSATDRSALPTQVRSWERGGGLVSSLQRPAERDRKTLFLPPGARRPVTYALNGTRFRLRPGNQIDLSRSQTWTVEFSAGAGLPQRSVVVDEPGLYVFQDTASGLDLVRADQPEPAPSDQGPLPPPPPADEMEEILPSPESTTEELILDDQSATAIRPRVEGRSGDPGNAKPRRSVLKTPARVKQDSTKKLKSVLEKSR